METAITSKTIGTSTYSISEEGKLTILTAGQHRVVYEPMDALELLQWLYAHREVFLSAAYPSGVPDWGQEGRTSEQETDAGGLQHALEQVQSKQDTDTQDFQHALEQRQEVATGKSTLTFQIRITEEPLTAQNFTTIISTLTELHTKAWLIQQGRFSDLINYAQTHDIRFTKEANLTIGKLAHNSPTLVELILNPTTLAAAAGAVVTLTGALKIAIDNVGQTSLRFKEKELDIEMRKQEAQRAQQTAAQQAEQERQKAQLEIEKQRLEIEKQRLEVEKNRVEVALETASKMIDALRPGIDMEKKGMLVQALLPTLLQLSTTEGLELVGPILVNHKIP